MERNELINNLRVVNEVINEDYGPYNEVLDKYHAASTRSYFLRAILLFYTTYLLSALIVSPLALILSSILKKDKINFFTYVLYFILFLAFIFVVIKVGKYLTRNTKFFMTKKFATSKIDAARSELIDKLNRDSNCLSTIPSEYWYPEASNYILRMVETNRAENIAQALALYDEYSYRLSTNNQINNMMKLQKETLNWAILSALLR